MRFDSKQQIPSLQVLRAIAACAVVYLHASNRVALTWGARSALSESIAYAGNGGVDMFFVLSGFLMTHLHRDQFGAGASLKFFRRRLIRIVPLYWLLSAIGMIALLAAPGLFSNVHTIDLPWALGNFLFVPWPQPSGHMVHIVMVGWTLDYEMYFYVLFALAMLFRSGLFMLTMAMCASVAIGMLLHPHQPWLQLLTSPMLLEFLTGVGLAVLVRRVRASARLGGVVLTLGVALLAMGAVVHGPRLWSWGIPSALVLLGCLWIGFRCESRIARALVVVGDSSYSIYLLQVFAIPVVALIFRAAGLGVLPIHVLIGLLWVSGCLAGVVCWKVVEKPMTDRLRRRTSSSTAIQPPNAPPQPLTVPAVDSKPEVV